MNPTRVKIFEINKRSQKDQSLKWPNLNTFEMNKRWKFCVSIWDLFEMILRRRFWTYLRWFWDRFKMVLRQIWDGFEMDLRRIWDVFEMVVRRIWDGFEMILRWFWDDFEMVLRRIWDVCVFFIPKFQHFLDFLDFQHFLEF